MSIFKGAFFALFFLFAFSLNGFSANKDNADYKSVLQKIIPPTINYSVKVVKNSELKGFDKLDISIKRNKMGFISHRYLWVSKDKKNIVPIVLKVGANGRIARVGPSKSIERFPIDVAWFYKLVNSMPKDLRKSYGKGRSVYMLSDPYCPYCKRELKKLTALAKEDKIKLHIIPFNIHGKKSEEASVVFFKIEKEKGLLAAINAVEGASYKNVDNIVQKHQKDIKKLNKSYKPILEKIEKTALKHGIKGTPVMIIKTSKAKGYLIVGISDITNYIK